MRRLVHILVRLTAGAIAVVVVLLGLLAARLSVGPVPLGFLAPTLARVLDGATPYTFQIGDAGILWRDWQRGLLLSLSEVHYTGDNGASTGQIGDITIAFSPRALARGVIAPSYLEAHDGEITLPRDILESGKGETTPAGSEGSADDLLDGLRGPTNLTRPLSFLVDVDIRNVSATIATPTSPWKLHIDYAELTRDAANRLGGAAVFSIAQNADTANLAMTLAPVAAGDDLSLQLEFSGLRPAAFATAFPALAPLAAVDLALHGTAGAQITSSGSISRVQADLSGSDGALMIDETLAAAAGMGGAAQRLGVRTLALRASFDSSNETAVVENADIRFVPATMLNVPTLDHRFPLAGFSVTGSWTAGRLVIPAANFDLDGLQIAATAALDNLPNAPAGTFTATANRIRVDDFSRYWPRKAAPGAYEWCIEHLHEGVIPAVTARITLATHNGVTDVSAADVRFDVERLTVDYLPPMPPVTGASGSVSIDLRTLRIAITGGQAGGMIVQGGTVVLPDLDRDPPPIDIDLSIAGPVPAAMRLISYPPMEYTEKIGITPEQTSGETRTRLRLRFPLLADLDEDEMDIDATIDLRDFGVTNAIEGVDIRRGQVRIDIDNDGLQAAGRLAIAGIDGDLAWTEAFAANVEPRTRLRFDAGPVPLAKLRAELRDLVALDPYLKGGAIAGEVGVVISHEGQAEIKTTVDLTHAALAIAEIGWHKAVGTAGTMDATIHLDHDRLTAIPHAAVLSPGLDVSGSMRLGGGGQIERIDIDRIITGRTHASGTLALLADGSWDISIGGISLDLSPLMDINSKDNQDSASRSAELPDFTLAADLETLWLGEFDPISRLQATAVHQRGMWPLVQLQGSLTDGSSLELAIVPETPEARSLSVSAENAGEALRAFDIFSDMVGGRLEAEGQFDDTDPAHPLTGRVRVRNFHVINTPILARLLSIMALTGIRDALRGRGIAFSTLEVPFQKREGMLTITNGRAFGSALGLTVSGDIDTRADMLDVRGRLVPFYAINSALGRLPLLGPIMTGGEKGGGVFSAGYRVSGQLSDPNVSVNPISVLFPGFLRWLLETFQEWFGPRLTAEIGAMDTGAIDIGPMEDGATETGAD